jgi:hypothetical protein
LTFTLHPLFTTVPFPASLSTATSHRALTSTVHVRITFMNRHHHLHRQRHGGRRRLHGELPRLLLREPHALAPHGHLEHRHVPRRLQEKQHARRRRRRRAGRAASFL